MADSTFLDSLNLNAVQRQLFDDSITFMDRHLTLPLLWNAAKLSSWHAVALLARHETGDVVLAEKLLVNAMSQQDMDAEFEQNYGSFKNSCVKPYSSGPRPLWKGDIYDSYDPNNALFFTMAGVMIHHYFADTINPDILRKLRESMLLACRGNIKREPGFHGDDMSPSYSNPFIMRCACFAYIGHLEKDEQLVSLSDSWMVETLKLWDAYDSPGEFNSPTYAGITLMALGLGQYCPPTSVIYKESPRLIRSTWRSLGETYNPTLANIAGPWDRAYGYCMTQYYACIGAPLASIIASHGTHPMPTTMYGASHHSDIALVPMQMIVAQNVESQLEPDVRSKFTSFQPHHYTPKSMYAPHDKVPREYSFYLSEGMNVGGVTFDEDRLGGPKGIPAQFCPGIIQWDSGNHGRGCGWISVWPNNSCCDIRAQYDSLTISYPEPKQHPKSAHSSSTCIELRISCLPFFQLDAGDFQTDRQQLPGLTVTLSGNVASSGTRLLSYESGNILHGAPFYRLVFTFENLLHSGEVPELKLGLKRTEPPQYPLRM